MSEGFAARGVQVLRADSGQPLQGVFLTMDPELWDPERRRLTLLLDPGRIKRGLVPNLEAGYPLNEGNPDHLVHRQPISGRRGPTAPKRREKALRHWPPAESSGRVG